MAPRTKKPFPGAALTDTFYAGNGLVPQPLPPSVEEAYRRKCRYLRHRTNEIEENNEVSRARLARLKRQAEKIRLERAYLLEQIAKRTSTNVEDSDGSPSPPPTPMDKPLRLKRGHRKPSVTEDTTAPNGTVAANATKHNGASASASVSASAAAKPPPTSAYEVYCSSMRRTLLDTNADKPEYNVDEDLERGWALLTDELRQTYQDKYDALAKEAADKSATVVADEDGGVNGVAEAKPEADKKDDDDDDDEEEKPEDEGDGDGDADVESKSEAKVSEVEAEIEADVEGDEDDDIEMADGEDTRPASPKDE
ncbi:hypothetical protein TD95_004532 [Thielaviopsis punctulata]|uniref:HMG box domain-containing protein n=1 Tax=Thielaviopsis punctulata TaxID=72032 RepID=A0A0F4ZEJ9_9PEZI|nr:hypothetical protein TD95_004532 [Thielaviopsis punctulata]